MNKFNSNKTTSGVQFGHDGTNKLRRKAISLYESKRMHELEPICRKILKKIPSDAYANYLLGISLQSKGNKKEAALRLKMAAEVNSENKVFILSAANALASIGNYNEALVFFKNLMMLQPNAEAIYNQIGITYIAMGRVKDAISYYKRALRLNANYVDCLNNLGNAFQELGKKKAAISSYERAIELKPNYSDAHYNLHAVQFSDKDPDKAINSLRAAINSDSGNMEAMGYLAMLLDMSGEQSEAKLLFEKIRKDAGYYTFLQESWEYIKNHRSNKTRIFSLTLDSLRYALSCAHVQGMILEFGVRYGTTINYLAGLTNDPVHGFDSFEGIPEEWKSEKKGQYTTYGNLPPVYSNVTLHQGWFDVTLPVFCARISNPVRLMNVDCDLYSSTTTIFNELSDRIKPGCVIVFDEYICNPGWQEDEYKAFQEYVKKYKVEYEYLLFSPFSKQAAVLIK